MLILVTEPLDESIVFLLIADGIGKEIPAMCRCPSGWIQCISGVSIVYTERTSRKAIIKSAIEPTFAMNVRLQNACEMIDHVGLQMGDQREKKTTPHQIVRLCPPLFRRVDMRINETGFALATFRMRPIG
jgi:hypothetical protein